MGCTVYSGDPGALEGCDFAHPPGMLSREQRTALTTARARGESKRDLGQLALRLRDLTVMPKTMKSPKSICDTTSCSLDFNLFGPYDCAYDSCKYLLRDAVLLPSVDDVVYDQLGAISRTSGVATPAKRKSSHRHIKKYSPKFSELLWLCLLGLLAASSAAPAPAMDPQLPPKWINPCGMGANEDVMPQDINIPFVSDRELLNQIVVQAKNAFSEADNYKEDYVKKVFNVDFEEHHKSWKQNHYDWLPSKEKIPKDLGEAVPQEHLEDIKKNMDGTLADTYEYLQKFAVGLEQVARDQRCNAGSFKDLFSGAEYKLRALLCEIQVAMIERGTKRRADVTRDIMADEFRTLDSSYRNLRDWLIYRDYMNALEYVIQVYEYFGANLA